MKWKEVGRWGEREKGTEIGKEKVHQQRDNSSEEMEHAFFTPSGSSGTVLYKSYNLEN